MSDKMREALERIADPKNTHFAGDAQVVAREALAEQPAQGEAVAKAKLWDTLNAALMSRSGITLDNERDCYEAARQWAEAHDDAGSYKTAVQKLRNERDTIAELKVEAVTLAAPPAPSVPDDVVKAIASLACIANAALPVSAKKHAEVIGAWLAAAPEVPR